MMLQSIQKKIFCFLCWCWWSHHHHGQFGCFAENITSVDFHYDLIANAAGTGSSTTTATATATATASNHSDSDSLLHILGPVHMDSEGLVDFQLVQFNVTDLPITKDFVVDVAVFRVDNNNKNNNKGLDQNQRLNEWGIGAEMNVGTSSSSSTWQPCCTREAKQKGLCHHVDRLITQPDRFQGEIVTSTFIATRGKKNNQNANATTNNNSASGGVSESQTIDITRYDPLLAIEEEGDYAVVFANCHQDAEDVHVGGTIIWETFYTVQEISHSAHIFGVLTLAYIVLAAWYGRLMKIHEDSRIDVEKWILLTISMGLAENGFRALDYLLFADREETSHSGTASLKWMDLLTVTVASFRLGISRCLLIMVGLGWGVTKASLSQCTMTVLITMVVTFTLLSFLEYSHILYNEKAVIDNDDQNSEGWVGLFEYLRVYIDFILFFWIPFALCKTMNELQLSRQERKLERYRWLLWILVGGASLTMLSFIVVLFQAADVHETANLMLLPEGNAVSFFLVLTAIAVLWRPNPNAREYAYAVELSAGADDSDDDDDNYDGPMGPDTAVVAVEMTETAVVTKATAVDETATTEII